MRITLSVFWCCVWWYVPILGMKRMDLIDMNSSILKQSDGITENWIQQKLDHFDLNNLNRWKQRYITNTNFYQNNGIVFLYLEALEPVYPDFATNAAWIDYAKAMNALCFLLEFRYYGKSQPTEDLSTENLRYLNTEQGLADTANFIVHMNKKYKFSTNTKWVVFGSNHAAWMRMKYPHLVSVAVCSSGVLLAKVIIKEYNEAIESILKSYSKECVTQITKATEELNNMISTDEGAKIIKQKFQLCSNLDRTNDKDVTFLFKMISKYVTEIVEYNRGKYDPSNKFITYKDICDIMTSTSPGKPIEKYANVLSKLLAHSNDSCLECQYCKMVNGYSNITWNVDVYDRQFKYQMCTEFGYLNVGNKMFGKRIDAKYLINECTDIFGDEFNLQRLTDGVNWTNTLYGGLNVIAPRTIYVESTNNAWKLLGLTTQKTEHTKIVLYKEGGLAMDTLAPMPTDPPQLKKARMMIKQYLSEYLQETDFVH